MILNMIEKDGKLYTTVWKLVKKDGQWFEVKANGELKPYKPISESVWVFKNAFECCDYYQKLTDDTLELVFVGEKYVEALNKSDKRELLDVLASGFEEQTYIKTVGDSVDQIDADRPIVSALFTVD